MFAQRFLAVLSRGSSRRPPLKDGNESHHRELRLEPLEDRALLSVGTPLGEPADAPRDVPEASGTPPVVLFEDFPSQTFDSGTWASFGDATIDDVGVAEPSAPFAVRLNGFPSAGDVIESVEFDLSDHDFAQFGYAFQRTGGGNSPEPGEDLVVSFLADGGEWVELDRQLGDGPDMTQFEQRLVAFPPEALHDGFRFRVSVTGTPDPTMVYDEWFVDDLSITCPDTGISVSCVGDPATSERGGRAQLTVALQTIPQSTVTIDVTSDDLTEGTVSPSSLTFTTSNWNVPQTVTVTGRDDYAPDGDVAYAVELVSHSSGAFYDGLVAEVTLVNLDDDATSPASLPFAEDFSEGTLPEDCWNFYSNGYGRIQVADGALRMDSSSSGGYGMNEAVLRLDLSQLPDAVLWFDHENPDHGDDTHTDGLILGELFTTPHRNADLVSISDDGVHWCVLRLLSPSASYVCDLGEAAADAGMTLSDDFRIKFQQYDNYPWDTEGRAFDNIVVRAGMPGLALEGASALQTSETGTSQTFTVALDNPPAADVTVAVSARDSSEGIVEPATLTFTAANWNVPQSATVTGLDDDINDGDRRYAVRLTTTSADTFYDGLLEEVTCINVDDDEAVIVSPPFYEQFPYMSLPFEWWDFYSTEQGRILVSSAKLQMDSKTRGAYALNEAILHVDLSDTEADLILAYDNQRSPGSDYPHDGGLEEGDLFTHAHWNADMVSVSDDGLTWYVLDQLETRGFHAFDLDAAIADAGMTRSADFRIKFQQYGNDSWDDEGRTFDDIMVREGSPGITVLPDSGLETTEGGETATFQVVLDAAPLLDVTVNIHSGDSSEGIASPINP